KALIESEQLAEPIFTPATKAESGHDQSISRSQLAGMIGTELARDLERLTLALYRFAHDYAASKGLILADTKFEFGMFDGRITLGDDVSEVRTGKEILVTFDAADEESARKAAERMGDQLLANPVIESYVVEVAREAAKAR